MRAVRVLVGVVFVLGLLAPMASANPAGPDAGVFQGSATVGKTSTCPNDGAGAVSGPGIGLPVVNPSKNAYYQLTTSLLRSVTQGPGTLNICGHLHPAILGLGAACGMSKADNGQGEVVLDNGVTVYVKNVGWKFSVGGLFIATGTAHTGAKSKTPTDGIVALVQAAGITGGSCATKRPLVTESGEKSGGATGFNVLGAYVLIPGGAAVADRNNAVTCKGAPPCLWPAKKH